MPRHGTHPNPAAPLPGWEPDRSSRSPLPLGHRGRAGEAQGKGGPGPSPSPSPRRARRRVCLPAHPPASSAPAGPWEQALPFSRSPPLRWAPAKDAAPPGARRAGRIHAGPARCRGGHRHGLGCGVGAGCAGGAWRHQGPVPAEGRGTAPMLPQGALCRHWSRSTGGSAKPSGPLPEPGELPCGGTRDGAAPRPCPLCQGEGAGSHRHRWHRWQSHWQRGGSCCSAPARVGDTGLGAMARHSLARHGSAQHSTAWHSMARHGSERLGMARHGTAQHGSTVWCGTAQHGSERFRVARHGSPIPVTPGPTASHPRQNPSGPLGKQRGRSPPPGQAPELSSGPHGRAGKGRWQQHRSPVPRPLPVPRRAPCAGELRPCPGLRWVLSTLLQHTCLLGPCERGPGDPQPVPEAPDPCPRATRQLPSPLRCPQPGAAPAAPAPRGSPVGGYF